MNSRLSLEEGPSLKELNTFGVPARALALARITQDDDVRALLALPHWGLQPKFVLGGGSNLLFTKDLDAVVLKVEVMGRAVLERAERYTLVEAGGGEDWHDFVAWTLAQGLPGLENMALIPGTVGAAPVQNIGAYGVELQDRFDSLDAVHLVTGMSFTLDAQQCRFSYRDSAFKHELKGKCVVTRVRFRLPSPWRPEVEYRDLALLAAKQDKPTLSPQQIFQWVCAIRRAKLPDPREIGNAGSFFKNPIVDEAQLKYVLDIDGNLVYYPLSGAQEGLYKLAAGWLIDACGWKGRRLGEAGVYDKQALVLINRGQATGADVWSLAQAIQKSVKQRFAVDLEPEPVLV